MKSKSHVSELDIQQALERFRIAGRLIRRLPDEPVPQRNYVAKRHAQYENPLSAQFDSGVY